MRKAFIALALGVMLAIGCAGHATARDEDGEFQVFLTKGKTVGVVSEPDWNFSADTDVTEVFKDRRTVRLRAVCAVRHRGRMDNGVRGRY